MGRKIFQGIVILVAMTFFLRFATFTEAVAGGEWAKPGEFPHAVQLSSIRTGFFCGGSIIAPSVILTAAHCVFNIRQNIYGYKIATKRPPKSILVTMGTLRNQYWRRFYEKQGPSILVDRYVVHRGFVYFPLINDIALLFLEKPVIYNDNVRPIQLPPPNVIFPRGIVAGWGYTDGKNVTSAYLKKLELDFEDRETCNNDPLMKMEPEYEVSDLELCAKFMKGRSTCNGDSGSSVIYQRPALVHDQQNKSQAVLPPSMICGIASWIGSKRPCGELDTIGAFLDVSQYLDWIQDTMEAEGFGNLIKPLTCSESEGFFDCGGWGLFKWMIKSRCILIEKKCDGVNNCSNGRNENVCGSMPIWVWACFTFTTLILIGIIMSIGYRLWNRYRNQNLELDSNQV